MFETIITGLYGTAAAIAGGGWCSGFYGGRGFGMMGGLWPFGMVFTGIFWIAVIVFAVWAIRRVIGSKSAPVTAESYLDILKRRLASGEITAEEFNKLRKTIDEKR